MMIFKKILFAPLIFILASFTIFHHGWANYDQEKVLDYTGVVLEPSYENPHSTMKIVHEDKEWLVILAPASRMASRGINKEMLKADVPVRVIGYPQKNVVGEMRAERR